MDLTPILTPLTPIAGKDLRLTSVLDELKELRREDDHDVSYGIWTYDLKVAHWDRLEKKTYDLLCTQTKDLEILLWYIESLIQHYKIQGLTDGIKLLDDFAKKFWDVFFPLDKDHRGALIEAFDRRLSDHLLRLNLCGHPDYIVTLLNWKNAQHMNNLLARDPSLEEELTAEYGMDLETVRNRLSMSTQQHITQTIENFKKIASTLKELIDLCDTHMPQAEVNFTETFKVLADIHYVLTKEIIIHQSAIDDQKEVLEHTEFGNTLPNPTTEQSDPKQNMTIKNREDVYQALQELTEYLQYTEQQSPIPALLDMLIGWRNKTLPQIIDDVQQSPQNYRLLYAIVGR